MIALWRSRLRDIEQQAPCEELVGSGAVPMNKSQQGSRHPFTGRAPLTTARPFAGLLVGGTVLVLVAVANAGCQSSGGPETAATAAVTVASTPTAPILLDRFCIAAWDWNRSFDNAWITIGEAATKRPIDNSTLATTDSRWQPAEDAYREAVRAFPKIPLPPAQDPQAVKLNDLILDATSRLDEYMSAERAAWTYLSSESTRRVSAAFRELGTSMRSLNQYLSGVCGAQKS
jgi:hypothetical protein